MWCVKKDLLVCFTFVKFWQKKKNLYRKTLHLPGSKDMLIFRLKIALSNVLNARCCHIQLLVWLKTIQGKPLPLKLMFHKKKVKTFWFFWMVTGSSNQNSKEVISDARVCHGGNAGLDSITAHRLPETPLGICNLLQFPGPQSTRVICLLIWELAKFSKTFACFFCRHGVLLEAVT